jgi:hypothetical protein
VLCGRRRRPLAPLITAVTGVVVTARAAAVVQLDARVVPQTEVRPTSRRCSPWPGVTIDERPPRRWGSRWRRGNGVSQPLLTGERLDLLQRQYDLMVLVRQRAGWVALVLLAVSVVTSRLPLRSLAVAAGLVTVIALVLPHLLAYGQSRRRHPAGCAGHPAAGRRRARVAAVTVPVAVVAAARRRSRGAAGRAAAPRAVGPQPDRVRVLTDSYGRNRGGATGVA